MALDFPNSPTVGQLYPAPPVAGLPSYKWDGSAWQLAGSAVLPLAPIDGKMYGSKDGAWQRSVALSGDTMTGALILNADPSNVLGAASKQYVDAGNTALTTAVNNRVRYDAAQGLNTGQQQTARQNIYAAPLDALAYSGMQINGAVQVSQEFGATLVQIPNGTQKYTADGWASVSNHSSGILFSGQTKAPYPGFVGGFRMVATAAFPSPANGNVALARHYIEGYRMAHLAWGNGNAAPLSYSFMFYTTISGVIFIRLLNNANNRAYYVEHTVTGASWNFCTATVPGDTAGTWLAENNTGILLDIFVVGKDAAPIAPGGWTTTIASQTTNSTNLLTTTGNEVIITGFFAVIGNELPTLLRTLQLMRPFEDELMHCQRFWQSSFLYGVTPAAGIGQSSAGSIEGKGGETAEPKLWAPFSCDMRAVPTITLYNPRVGGAVGQWGGGGVDSANARIIGPTTKGFVVDNTAVPITGSGQFFISYKADARL